MPYYAGIDGGQSSTVAVVGDETGHILGRGTAGPADEVGQDANSTRLHDALDASLHSAIELAKLPANTRFERIVAGISGFEGKIYGRPPQLPTDALILQHDTVIAHAGSLDGKPGVVLIAGTGSVAYAVNENESTALIGGWGYLFGDEGSAFWLARDVLAGAMRDSDAGERNELAQAALQYFNLSSLRKVARAFYAGTISRAQVASFAIAIVRYAERGNAQALQYVSDAAGALARLAMYAADRVALEAPKVALTGGLFRSRTMYDQTAHWIRELLPRAVHVPAAHDPATGALLLAYKAGGISPPRIIE